MTSVKLESYKKEKLTINMLAANIFSLVLFIVVFAAFGILFLAIYGKNTFEASNYTPLECVSFLVLAIVGIVAHEFVHGICWSQCVEGGWKTIKFGVMWKSLSPYCHCSEPMKVRNYKFGALAPLFVVGVMPTIIALFVGNSLLLLFGMLFIAGAAGDIMVWWILRKEKSDDYVVDHPSEAGCWIYRKIE